MNDVRRRQSADRRSLVTETTREVKVNKACNFCGNKNFKGTHVQYIYRHNDQC